MDQLTKFLIKELVDGKSVTAIYGGGFKPPTKGHFDLVKATLKDFPEIDKFIIYVGGGVRDGIGQEQSLEIWGLYKEILGKKIEIIPSSAPIGDILRYAKTHPDDEVYFVIGYREGRQDDIEDISSRTKGVEEKYPNIKIKVITTTNGDMSGTNARKSIGDKEKFFTYLPDEVPLGEKEEVYNIVSKSLLKEGVIFENKELDTLQLYSPSEIRSRDLPKEGGIYFWWVNSEAAAVIDGLSPNTQIGMCQKRNVNGEEYSLVYVGLAKNLSSRVKDWHINQKHSDSAVRSGFISTLRHTIATILGQNLYAQEAVNNFQNKYMLVGFIETEDYKAEELKFIGSCSLPLNIRDNKTHPFYKELKALRKISKQQSINEHSMGNSIDLKSQIDRLTQHMIDKGYNIEPLPSLEFVDDDITNAEKFLGKTAYYDPINKSITLYTHGRHPKDIARSYAHEMIHHIQNLEDRLGDITTTNTQEDDKLNKLEAEANLKGTMTFRNWTDGLDEGKNKDPFGLNQYARELAQGLEEEQLTEGRYDKFTNELSSLAFELIKDGHSVGRKILDEIFIVGPEDEDPDIISNDFEFDFRIIAKYTNDVYTVDGGANAGYDDEGDEIQPLLSVKFKIPKNPDWQTVSFDLKDVIRHELEHLTQDGGNLKGGTDSDDPRLVRPSKYMADDKLFRDMIDADLLPKATYFKLEKEVDAMLQGLYLKAKKSKKPFLSTIDDYLDKQPISQDERKEILNLWAKRAKALSLPSFTSAPVKETSYLYDTGVDKKGDEMRERGGRKPVIFCDMDGVLVNFDKGYQDLTGMSTHHVDAQGKKEFWKAFRQGLENSGESEKHYWANLDWQPGGKELWDYIKEYNPYILTAPSVNFDLPYDQRYNREYNESMQGKLEWVQRLSNMRKIYFASAVNKPKFAGSNKILIDDRKDTIDSWNANGGIGILHTSAESTIKQLKELGL
jgi:hypothetical protein